MLRINAGVRRNLAANSGLAVLGVAVLGLAAGESRAQCALQFAPATGYQTGAYPLAVALGDVNHDGILDAVSTSFSDQIVSVLLGDGRGGFLAPTAFGAGLGSWGVALADFDNDTHADIVVVNLQGNNVSVLRGNGDGTFQTATQIAVGTSPSNVVAADFNMDGNMDMAVCNYGGTTVSVLRGQGGGTFQAPTNYTVGNHPIMIRGADINSDGRLDLISLNENQTLSVLLGNVSGFSAALTTTISAQGTGVQDIALSDFNSDNILDVAICNYQTASVTVMRGLGNGLFNNPVNFATNLQPFSMAMADYNGDGSLDLATISYVNRSVSVLRGNNPPNGSFQTAMTFPIGVGVNAFGISAGDLNGDGRPDIVGTLQNDLLGVLLNGAPTNITQQPRSQLTPAGQPIMLSVTATGTYALSYQWRKDGVILTNGGRITGATSANLTISQAVSSDIGAYDVIIRQVCGVTVGSTLAIVAVSGGGGGGGCPVDLNQDGTFDADDVQPFVNMLLTGSPCP